MMSTERSQIFISLSVLALFSTTKTQLEFGMKMNANATQAALLSKARRRLREYLHEILDKSHLSLN